jgi:ribonuclease P protein component
LRTRALRHYPEHRRGAAFKLKGRLSVSKLRAASQSGKDHEENVSTEPVSAHAASRISRAYGDQERTQGPGTPPGQGAQAPVGVTGQTLMMKRLKKRRDFLAAAKGQKTARRAFVLEARRRDDSGQPRVGFTVSKRIAKKAVERNRIRRRLKEAVRLAEENACTGYDYVLVGRTKTLTEPFSDLRAAVGEALRTTAILPNSDAKAAARRS